MKMLSNALAVVGVLIAVGAIVGRFVDKPTIVGFTATGLLGVSNTCLLISLVLNTLKK
jgi:hypothetical protein